jgi:hypothetical protein
MKFFSFRIVQNSKPVTKIDMTAFLDKVYTQVLKLLKKIHSYTLVPYMYIDIFFLYNSTFFNAFDICSKHFKRDNNIQFCYFSLTSIKMEKMIENHELLNRKGYT